MKYKKVRSWHFSKDKLHSFCRSLGFYIGFGRQSMVIDVELWWIKLSLEWWYLGLYEIKFEEDE